MPRLLSLLDVSTGHQAFGKLIVLLVHILNRKLKEKAEVGKQIKNYKTKKKHSPEV
jgi:hypothetical protein